MSVLSAIGHGALGFRSGMRDLVSFFDEPGGTPQTFAEVRLGHPVQPSEWASDSGAYAAPFYRAIDGVPLDVVAVQTVQRSLVRVESVAACAALVGSYYYPSQPTSHGAWDGGELWDGGGLWDRGSFVYVNATAAERAQTIILRCPVGFGTDSVTQPLMGVDLLTNGSFETGTLSGWTESTSGGGSVGVAAGGRSGSYGCGLALVPPGSASIYQDSIAVVAGATYVLYGSILQPLSIAGALALGGGGLRVQVSDSGGDANATLSDGRSYGASTDAPSIYHPVGDWRRWAFYFVARQSSLRVKLQALSYASCTVDGVSLRRVFRWLRYEPRLVEAPQVSESRRDKFFGPWQVGASRLDLANDGTLETALGALDTINAEVLVRVGGRFPASAEEITGEGLRTSYVGRVTDFEVGEGSAVLDIEDVRGMALVQLPRRVITEQAYPQADPRLFGTPRPMLWGYGEDMPARRIDRTAGGLGIYEVADCDDWTDGIAVNDATTGRLAEVRMFQDEDAASRGDTSLSTDVTDHVTFDATTGRFTSINALKPVPVDEEHQFYSFSFNAGLQIDCRVLDANEETVLLTPTSTGANNNFAAIGAPTIWQAISTLGDSARANSASTSGTRRCEIGVSALSGSAAVAYVELVARCRSLNDDPENGDRLRFYVEISGTRYYGTWVDEPTGGYWAEHRYKWELNPSSSAAWTEAAINAITAWGIEYDPNSADYLNIDTLIPQVRRYKSTPATASRPSIRSPKQFAAALQQAMLAAASLSSGLAVTFDETTFAFTVTGSGPVTSLTLHTKTGRQKSGWAMLGYGTDADKSGALTYTASSAYYDPDADLDAAVLRVACMGYVDDTSGTYTGIASAAIEKGPDVLRHILERGLGVPAERFDAASFEGVRAAAPTIAVYVSEPEGVEQIIERIETGDLADLTFDDETWLYARRASAWASGGVELRDRDFLGGLKSGKEQADLYGLMRVLWGPGRLSAEETATDYALRYGRADVRPWETYLTSAADASDVLVALAAASTAKRRYRLAARGVLLRVRPGQVVRLYPVQGGLADSDGAYSPVDVRILSRQIDYQTQIVAATAVEV